MTRNSITTWAVLERELDTVRRTGLAFDREESFNGICAVATGVRGPDNEIAAISLPVPADRFRITEKSLAETLLGRSKALRRRI